MQFYHISTNGNLEKIWYPRIPKNSRTTTGEEDSVTPRICVSPTISHCLMGKGPTTDLYLEESLKENFKMEFYVYVPTCSYRVIKPSVKQIPEVNITQEHWILDRTKFELHSKILADFGKKKLVGKYKIDSKYRKYYENATHGCILDISYKTIKRYNKISKESCVYLW